MYAQIVKWTVKPGTLDRVYQVVGESLEAAMRTWPEFRGYYDIKTGETTAVVVLLYSRMPTDEVLGERLKRARDAVADYLLETEIVGRGEVIREIR
jgi:hypothetical protein